MSDKKKPAPKIAIIILNWNQKDYTLACLDSLMESDYSNYEVMVIDNVSTDGSCEAVEKRFPSVRLIRNEKNLGLTDSRNIGVDHALRSSADYILFLDNDTIVDKDMVAELVQEAEKDKLIAVVTPKIYFYTDQNRIWALGGKVNFYKGQVSLLGHGEMDRGQFDSSRAIEVDYAIGCCSMIRSDIIKKIGKLDPRFYYGEDTEFCIRAQRSGYKIMAVPKATMWHKDSRSWAKNDDVKYIRVKAVTWVIRKYARFYHWLFLFPHAFFSLTKIVLREGLRGNFKSAYFRIKGFLDAMRT